MEMTKSISLFVCFCLTNLIEFRKYPIQLAGRLAGLPGRLSVEPESVRWRPAVAV